MQSLILNTVTLVCVVGVMESALCGVQFPCWSREINFSVKHPLSPCSESGLCVCSVATADCSAKHLNYVPYIDRDYKNLNISNNNLTTISDESFFVNVSREVTDIDLFNNGLVHIAPGPFRRLYKLTTLLLGGLNYISYKDMPALLSISSLRYLGFSCLNLGPMPVNVLQHAQKSQLIALDLSWNNIPSLNMSVFQPLRSLRHLSLWNNKIYTLAMAYLPGLERLDLDINRIFDFPSTCSSSGLSLLPNLSLLSLNQNMIDCIYGAVCLPRLTKLFLNYNHFKHFRVNSFSSAHFPVLDELQIMQMENKILTVGGFFINNSMVTRIIFNFNAVDFSASVVDNDAFGGCVNVAELAVRGNSFLAVTDDRFHRLLEPMEDCLQILYLTDAQLTFISIQTFSRFTRLKKLYLYDNSLSSIPDGTFDGLLFLKTLTLNGNKITTISENTFGLQLRSR